MEVLKNSYLGCKFWKTNKKIKAITEEDYHCYRGLEVDDDENDDDFEPLPTFRRSKYSPAASPIILTSSDDDDYGKPCTSKGKGKKIKKKTEVNAALEERVTKLERALHTNPTSCDTCTLVEELFKCCVCKSILQQDCILLVCCKQLVCKMCITQWLATNQSCPLCRESINVDGNTPAIPRSVLELILLLSKKESKNPNE